MLKLSAENFRRASSLRCKLCEKEERANAEAVFLPEPKRPKAERERDEEEEEGAKQTLFLAHQQQQQQHYHHHHLADAPVPDGFQRCTGGCGKILKSSLANFHRNTASRTGFQSRCKVCLKVYNKARSQSKIEKKRRQFDSEAAEAVELSRYGGQQ